MQAVGGWIAADTLLSVLFFIPVYLDLHNFTYPKEKIRSLMG
jgi:hypothetical protein